MILSLDIGATKIAFGLVKGNRIFSLQKVFWQKPLTTQKIINKIIEIISSFLLTHKSITHITIGIAGQVDLKTGKVDNFFKKTIRIPLVKILKNRFCLPVYLDNDAHCFTLAEAILGLGQRYHSVVGLTLGTGLGGGLAIKQKLYRGKNNIAGEFGHQIIQLGGRQCTCGKRGCWEAYVSGKAITNLYFELTGQRKNVLAIKKEFRQKHLEAEIVVNETARYLAIGLANLINTLNPEIIVLGGGLIKFKPLFKIALKEVKNWLLVKERQRTPILISQLGEQAGILGATLLIKENK